MTDRYDSIRNESKDRNEDNDCAVRAVALATDSEYGRIHRRFKRAGRISRKGTPRMMTRDVVKSLANIRDVKHFAPTVAGFCREADKGTFLVFIRRHVLCVRDGVCHDWTDGRRFRINAVWKIIPKKSRKSS
jgi:hypothetical protein